MEPAQIGRYELHAPLGRGGMGTVYKARDPRMERWVAVKTITVQDAHQRDRFQQEVRAAGSLNHPHITTIYDVGEQGDLAYIVMELVEGETLANRLTSPISWREAVSYLLPICRALGYAHSKGVIHRDVKPANILISAEGQVKLTDFGVARLEAALRRITESGSTVGTPIYTAPEQLRNEQLDGRADLFSVGIVLFEVITGLHPFMADTLAQVIYRITQTEPADLTALALLAPPALVDVAGRALRKDPAGRFTDAGQMAAALAACLEQPEAAGSTTDLAASASASGPSTPEQPILDPVSNISLSPLEEKLLRRAFAGHDRVYLEREFSSGYSGARVLLATPVRSGGKRLAQVVLKLDTPAAIDREWQAYQEYVKDTLPPVTARILEEPLSDQKGELALLRYTFAGGFGNALPESLRQYYAQHSGEEVAALLEKSVFRAFGAKWWLQRKTTDLILRREYDRLLPIHLIVENREFSEVTATPRNLIAGQTNAESCRQLRSGQLIQLQDFFIAEVSPNQQELTLQARPPSGSSTNPIRVRVVGSRPSQTNYQVGQTVSSLIGVVTATRHELLGQLAEPAFPGQNLRQKQITLGGQLYPNPLFDYESLLDQRLAVMSSIIHGDLNWDNILVTPASGLAWLIDFATTRMGHNLYDFMRLETQVITKLVPQTRAGPEAVAQMMHALHQPDPSPKDVPADLRKPFAVLVTIRRMVRVCQYSRDDWDEYYLGLVITLLGALKFKELDARTRGLTIAAAAVGRGLITNPTLRLTPVPVAPPAPVSKPARPWLKLAIGAAILVVILALLTALVLRTIAPPPVSRTETPSLKNAPLVAAAPSSTATPTPTSTSTATRVPSPTLPEGGEAITNKTLDIRTGPGVDYPTLNSISAGIRVQVTGRSDDGRWWQISYPDGPSGYGWLPVESVDLAETIVPPVTTAPLPPAQPTVETASPAVTPSPTPCTATYFSHLSDEYPGLGCPLEAWSSDFKFQEFERGLMIWRKSPTPSRIFVLYDDDTWRSETDPQGPRQPACSEAEQTGNKGPILSFGLIWCNTDIERLGLPITGELAVKGSHIEKFQQGLALRLDQTVYVLFDDNRWQSITEALAPGPKPVDTPAPPSADDNNDDSLILEDFESYNSSSLQQAYVVNNAWDKNELTVQLTTLSDLPDNGQVAVLVYSIKTPPPEHYVGLERNLADAQDWSRAETLQFWTRNSGSAVDLVFQWGERQAQDGEVWRVRLPLQLGETRLVEIPLSSQYFSRTDWSASGNGQMDLDQVNYYAFFVERSQPGQGALYLDEVKLRFPHLEPSPPESEPPSFSFSECQAYAAPEFDGLWSSYGPDMGCPTGSMRILPFHVEEAFEGGQLIWRDDTDEVYLIYDRQKNGAELLAGNWELPGWKWDGIAVCPGGQTPPPGLLEPERGFGWLWCTHLGGPNGPLGWALNKEQGFDNVARVQRFEHGLAFKGSTSRRYALLDNDRFLVFDPTSIPPPGPTETLQFAPTGFEPAQLFAELWDRLDQGSGPLGFPLGSAITNRNYARQSFERGFMFWWESLEDPQPIWVIYLPDPMATQGDSWTRYDNKWFSGQPEVPPSCPEAGGGFGPKFGFGLTWCNEPGVKAQLGAPLEGEFGSGDSFQKGAVQYFQGGVMFENPADRQVWALLDGDGWYRLTY